MGTQRKETFRQMKLLLVTLCLFGFSLADNLPAGSSCAGDLAASCTEGTSCKDNFCQIEGITLNMFCEVREVYTLNTSKTCCRATRALVWKAPNARTEDVEGMEKEERWQEDLARQESARRDSPAKMMSAPWANAFQLEKSIRETIDLVNSELAAVETSWIARISVFVDEQKLLSM